MQTHKWRDFLFEYLIGGFHHPILPGMDMLLIKPAQMMFPMQSVGINVEDATKGIQCTKGVQQSQSTQAFATMTAVGAIFRHADVEVFLGRGPVKQGFDFLVTDVSRTF